MLQVQTYTGSSAQPFIPELARLRIQVFRDFPYLYEGDMAYEEAYLETFLQAPDSVLVIATDGSQVVGASTGLPMESETENIQQAWLEQGFDTRKIFYYGESVLEKAHRGRGLGVQFFEHREAWAKSLGRFEIATFCGVLRPADHPLRPADYKPLDAFWQNRGFAPADGMQCRMAWQDLHQAGETEKTLSFWWKRLTNL